MQSPLLLDNLQWKLGRGKKIRFWKYVWIKKECLMRRFPRIFETSKAQNMMMQDAYRNNNGSVEWLINVTRNLQDWEIREFENLLLLLATQQMPSGEDKVR